MRGLYILRSSSATSTGAPVNTSAAVKVTAPNAAPPLPPPSAGQTRHHHHDIPQPPPAFHASASIPVQPQTSARSIRPKQVTDPLTETVRARLCGTPAAIVNYSSSGSQHDPSSVCLAAMVNEFLEEEINTGDAPSGCGMARCNCADGVCSGEACDVYASPDFSDGSEDTKLSQLCEILEGITSCHSNPELLLLVDVVKALESETEELRPVDEEDLSGGEEMAMSRLRRPVMKRLREEGYNAAVCKSRWSHSDGLPAGDYEYIDVLINDPANDKSTERYIVDIDFRAQFEIARASGAYCKLLGSLPRVFVGRGERLKQILKIMSDASKRSLRGQGLLLPPWRKQRYLQAKWFSAYRRTTNDGRKQHHHQRPCRAANNIALKAQGPNMFDNLQFTKEMDMIFFNAQLMNPQSRAQQPWGYSSNRRVTRINSPAVVRGGFGGQAGDQQQHVCTVMSTDWQLPSVEINSKSKAKNGTNRVSGLSSALKSTTTSQLETNASSSSTILRLANNNMVMVS